MKATATAVLTILATLGACSGGLAAPWTCTLPDTLVVQGNVVTVGVLSRTPVPAAAEGVVVLDGGAPGAVRTVSRRLVLRQLVSAGLSAGLRMAGPVEAIVRFEGTVVPVRELAAAMRAEVVPLLPEALPGAPATWFELEEPTFQLAATGPWTLAVLETGTLPAGRQQVRYAFSDGTRQEVLTANLVVHRYGEVGKAVRRITRGEVLGENLFNWEWADQADGGKGRVVGRRSLAGSCAARTLSAGGVLLEQDLKPIPLILSGDAVELTLARGSVEVSVRAFARQEGCLGQTIPVRNELTGRLVNARVTGPGSVEWRR